GASGLAAAEPGAERPEPRREADHAGEGGQAFQDPCSWLMLPDQLDVGDESWHQHEVEVALAEHLVGDVDPSASRIPGFGPCRRRAGRLNRTSFHRRFRWGDGSVLTAGWRYRTIAP